MSIVKISNDISLDQHEEVQLDLLSKMLERILDKSKFYKSQVKGIEINKQRNLKELLSSLPFTSKKELAVHNEDFICATKGETVDYVTTSGTTGSPVSFALTYKDVERIGYNEVCSFDSIGLTEEDTIQLMTTIDKQFMAGIAYYQGALQKGCALIRIGPGAPLQQWEAIKKYQPKVLICVPSFIPILLDYAKKEGLDYKSSSVKALLCIGEPVRNIDFTLNPLGLKISNLWDVEIFSTYASTEMAMAFTECSAHQGGHLIPELGILEVLDENNNQVKNGESGEVVITNLQVEGTPLIRFRTGDVCHYYSEPCSCGKHTPRLGPVIGRKQQMIKFKGTTIFPATLFDVLDYNKEITLYQVIVTTNEYGNNEVTILLSTSEIDDAKLKSLKEQFKIKVKVTPHIDMKSHEELKDLVYPEDSRKMKKLIYI
jgi:phenylacetate-CoA ligase